MSTQGSSFKVAGRRDVAALVLTVIAWFWTAYECDTIGIDVFDTILLKSATHGVFVWILAAVLAFLCYRWMRPHLLTRAICALLMLLPGEAFKLTRPLLPDSGFAPIQLVVALLYLGAIVGMWGMFYPWRLERLLGVKAPSPADGARQ